MMFDKMCGLVERHAPQFRKYMEEAKIFLHPESFGSNILTDEQINNFFLPFKTVAIESPQAVTIYSDHERDQLGLSEDRTFIDCAYASDLDRYEITQGVIHYKRSEQGYNGVVRLDFAIICNKNRILFDWAGKWDDDILGDAQNNASLGINRFLYINTIERFILEESPIHIKTNKSKKITRSEYRSKYILLTPGEIRQKLGIVEHIHQGGTKIPHERRRHTRTLRSDRFTKKQGQTLIIPATWIGDREKIVGDKIYRVRTDL
ncbi:MAG: hypothetical protein ABSF90_20950 [Syntrophobacteraceae bacterium]|jgi:hypothetical protein